MYSKLHLLLFPCFYHTVKGTGASREDSLPLSVEGQVQRLIEEATAVENLVQMYIGWQPWA